MSRSEGYFGNWAVNFVEVACPAALTTSTGLKPDYASAGVSNLPSPSKGLADNGTPGDTSTMQARPPSFPMFSVHGLFYFRLFATHIFILPAIESVTWYSQSLTADTPPRSRPHHAGLLPALVRNSFKREEYRPDLLGLLLLQPGRHALHQHLGGPQHLHDQHLGSGPVLLHLRWDQLRGISCGGNHGGTVCEPVQWILVHQGFLLFVTSAQAPVSATCIFQVPSSQ